MTLPIKSMQRRTSATHAANRSACNAWGPSHSACSGDGWTSTIRPSAPATTAARAIGRIRSRLPAACDGSTITGRLVRLLATGTAEMSSVERVAVSKVLIPRSHRMIWSLPSLAMYSAESSHSSIVLDKPRLRSTGRPHFPTSCNRSKFCMLRAPSWMMSATSRTSSNWRMSMHSVTIGRPVSARASARMPSAGLPSPLKAYGDVRGLYAPPRRNVAPTAAQTRAVSMVCSRVSTVQGPAISAKCSPPILRPAISSTRSSRWNSRETSLNGLRIGSTFSTPGSPSRAIDATSSRSSPIAPITVINSPRTTCALAPASSMR